MRPFDPEKRKQQNQTNNREYAGKKNLPRLESPRERMNRLYNSNSGFDELDYEKFIEDSMKFLESYQTDVDSMDWSNHRDKYAAREASWEALRTRGEAISSYLEQNRDKYGDDVFNNFQIYMGRLSNASVEQLMAMAKSEDYFSQWETEDDYNFWKDHGTVENRQNWYAKQQDRLDELIAQRSALVSEWENVTVRPGTEEFFAMQREYEERIKGIRDEIAAVETGMRNYERGNADENGRYYGSKVVDDYYGISQRADFDTVSTNRDFGNATKEDFDKWYYQTYGGIMTDPVTGTEIAGSRIDPGRAETDKETLAINDPLGFYLDTKEYLGSDKARYESYGVASREYDQVMNDAAVGSWDFLDETEIGIYYALLNEQGIEAARKYLDDMTTELNKRETFAAIESYAQAYDESSTLGKILMNVATVPSSVMSAPFAALDYAVSWANGEDINPYSEIHAGMHYSNTVRGKTSEEIDADGGGDIPLLTDLTGFTLGDAYQSGMSVMDSMASMGIGGRFGGVILASSAANSEAQRLYEQGASRDQVAFGAAASAAAELVFESVSIGSLFDMKDAATVGQAVRNILVQGGVEASEEVFTEIANTITNAVIMGDQSDWAKLVKQYGGDEMAAFQAKVRDAVNAGIGGFLSGGTSGSTASVGSTIGNYTAQQTQYADTGRTINFADGGVEALMQLANQVAGVSQGRQQRNLSKATEAVGKKATDRNVGRLYNAVVTANNLANASQNQADIAQALNQKGFNRETANDIAQALVRQYNGQTLSRAQAKLLESVEKNRTVSAVISEILNDRNSAVGQRSQNIRDFENGISRGVAQKTVEANVTRAAAEKQFAPEETFEVSDRGQDIRTDTGESIQIRGVSSIGNGQMQLDIGDGNTVDANSVSYATEENAQIYEAISKLGDKVDADTANKLIRQYDGGNGAVFARGITQAYTYGYYGLHSSELTGESSLASELSRKQREFAYNLGAQYRTIRDQVDKATARAVRSAKAVGAKGVFYRGKDGNVTDFRTYENESGAVLKDEQRTAIEVMERMSQVMGVRFNVFESWVENGKRYYLDENGVKTEGNPNGFYDTRTGEVYIDLEAGNDYQGTMLFTLAHELTHFIRQWSPEHFTKIAKIVFQNGGMQGHVGALVARKQAKAEAMGNPISYDTAMEEAVADGMETILKDGKVVEFMADVKKADRTAWEKIKDWFQDVAKLLKELVSAYSAHSAQTTEGARVAAFSQDLLEQIEQIWAEGAVAAGENYQAAEGMKNTTGEGGVKYVDAIKRSERIVDQIRNSITDIMALNAVYTIDSSNATPYTGTYKTDEDSGKNVFKKQGGYANRPGFGRVVLGKKGVVSTVFHGNGPAKQAAFPAIKAVIEKGIEIGRDDNHNGKGFDTVIFAAPVHFFGAKAPLGVVVKVSINGRGDKSFYIHEICDAEGNYIELADGVPTKKEISSTGLVDSISTADAADNGIAPKTSIHNESKIVKSESAEAMDVELDTKTESVAPRVLKSERTWTASDYVQERGKAAQEIARAIGVSVKKAESYIDSVNSIAKMIAEDRVRLDYFSSPGRSSFVGNVEYGGSFDFSTLCKKRRLLTGTFTAIQKALPNTALTANEILDIRNRMRDAGLEVSCGLCYVEGSRANMGQFSKEFLNLYKQYYPDAWQPNMADVNTPDGIEWVRINHPECYEQYEYFWNHYGTLKPGDKNLFASQQKPKLYQLHTEYKGEILEKFNDDDNVEEKNLNGGIRLQSFSDFEIVHLIDTMQIIMDMSRVGLAGQAYTKVPDFAWALGDTGLKINLSLIAKGVDENGKLVFDDVEGMPIDTATALRDRYSKNVGTVLVAFNDDQLLAAMADERVDFIIPFHRSQWKKSQYEAMGLPAKTKDYTYMQNEKFIKPQYHEYRGRMVRDKASNYMPNEYWDFEKSGKENAESYLEMCARNNKRPKFYKLLENNGDGSYSLKADGTTDGYWKLLIDFKMYDNDGKGSPQMPVQPEFNMDEARRMLDTYRGGHSSFPVAQGVVDGFVKEYKDSHKGVRYSDRDSVGNQLSERNDIAAEGYTLRQERSGEAVSNRALLANALEGVAQNEIEAGKIREYKEQIGQLNEQEQKLRELNGQIKELSFARGPRDKARITALREEATKTANRISTYDKILLRLEASAPLQAVLNREKETVRRKEKEKGKAALDAYKKEALEAQKELTRKWQESRKKATEGRNRTAMRHKIKDVVNELNRFLLHGNKERHVPIELQKAVAEALDAVNMDTVGAEERIARLEAELLKAKTPEKIQEISRKIDHVRQMGDRMNERLQKLKNAYDQFVNSDDPLVANGHDEVISNKLESVIREVGDTPLRDMSLKQLEDVYDMYRMVLTTIRNANKAFTDKKNETISTIAERVMKEIRSVGGKNTMAMKGIEGIKTFGWNNLKPVYAFEHIGSQSFKEIFDNVRAGEDVWAVDVTEAKEFYLEQSKKHNYDKWDFIKRFSFESASGMEFSLGLDQIMSLYAYSKRDQAAEHLRRGGIVIDETTEIIEKNKLGIPVKYNPTEATAYNIDDMTLAEIVGKLTDEQKAFVDEMQEYLASVMGGKGNAVSLELYGIKLFKDKFYFPLKSATQFMAKAKEQQQGEKKIKNSGFSKETVPRASNPIVLTPFMDVWAGHVNDMSMYHAFVLPMEDFYRVYNYKTQTSETAATESVEMHLQNAYGRSATKYIDQLLSDLNGGARTDTTTGIINKMTGLFKKGAVFCSLSVVVQQPSAIARAAAIVDPKYFIGPKVDKMTHKELWGEVKQYAPVAIIKEMGYFDTNMGQSTRDFILGKEYSGFVEKMKALVTDSGHRDEMLSKAPAMADEIAWCGIWQAVKREIKAKNPAMDTKSTAFLQAVGKRFTEVIVKTQVYDSVLARSGLMRSKDTGMKMATAFMAEPTTNSNMVADALLKGKRGDKAFSRRAVGAVIASQILNSILVAFVYAARDDDEDKTYLEKYLGTLTEEMLDSLNPAGYIPFLKDIVSIVQGYDVERSDMAVIADLWKAWENLSNGKLSTYKKVEGFAGSVAQIFGLPVKNIMRDVRSIWQTVASFIRGPQTTSAGIGYAVQGSIPEVLGGGEVTQQNQLYDAYLSGDETQLARVIAQYADGNAANNAMRSAIKSHFLDGDIDGQTAMAYLVEYTGMDEDDAFWRVEEWVYENASGEDFGKYDEFYAAAQTGKDLKAVIQKYTENGVTEETLRSQLQKYFKPLYMQMSTHEKADIKGYLLNALTTLGESREDAQERIGKWEFEADYPEMVGRISYAQYKKWQTDGKPNGVTIELFADVAEYRSSGESGKTRSQDEVKAYIMSATNNNRVRHALWCCFYKASTSPWK